MDLVVAAVGICVAAVVIVATGCTIVVACW